MKQWYAVHTKHRRENQVCDYLAGRGIETYLPVLPRPARQCRTAARQEPFFARYLFAHLDLSQVPSSSINWAPGVTRLVCFAGQPAAVREEVILWLRHRLARGVNADHDYKGLPIRPNDRLRVIAGPLRGMEAIFDQRLSADDRARVLVQLLGRLTACDIPLIWLERI